MSRMKEFYEQISRELQTDPIAITDRAVFALTVKIESVLEEKGLLKYQLAEMAGLHPAQITRVLSGAHNFTMATLGRIAAALDLEFEIHLRHIDTAKLTVSYPSVVSFETVYGRSEKSGTEEYLGLQQDSGEEIPSELAA